MIEAGRAPRNKNEREELGVKPTGQAAEFRLLSRRESERLVYRDLIERQYDELLDERETLQKKMADYNVRDYDVIFTSEFADDASFRKIAQEWLGRVRSETTFLQSLDDIGIQIFKDDLEHQPEFPEEEIIFASQEIRRQQIVELRAVGGFAKKYQPVIEIDKPKPSQRIQLHDFLAKGTINGTVSILVHELIHRYHHRSGQDIDGVLTEAQAYFSGIFEVGPHFSLTQIARTLSQSQEQGGLYEYDTDQVINALRTMATLYGLGMSYSKVGKLVIQSHYQSEQGKFLPLEGVMEKKLTKHGLNDIDAQALDDLYRLRVNNERNKARLMLFEVFAKHYNLDELRAAKLHEISHTIGVPSYYDAQGNYESPEKAMLQNTVALCTDEFPYDPHGKRTAIIFGFFFNDDESPAFGIGRYEAEGTRSAVTLATTAEARARYLERLAQHAPEIKPIDKLRLFYMYLQYGLYQDMEARTVLTTLINQQEGQKIVREWSSGLVEDSFIHVNEALEYIENSYELSDEDLKKLSAHKDFLDGIQDIFAIFNLQIEDGEETMVHAYHNLRERITELKNAMAA